MKPIVKDFHPIITRQLKDTPKWTEVLKLGVSITDKHFHNHQLGFGTLLGAVRDGTVIPHDIDLDIDVLFEEVDNEMVIKLFNEEMSRNGFKLLRQQYFDYLGKTLQMSTAYTYKESCIIFDVCFFRRFGDDYLHFGTAGLVIRPSYTKEYKDLTLGGVITHIPIDSDKYLTGRYGAWKTPANEKSDWDKDASKGDLFIPWKF